MAELDEIIRDFLNESRENLDQLDDAFLALEKDPANKSVLTDIFRTVHTLKSTCGFLGFGRLEKLTHAGEHLLGELREGNRRLTPAMATVLLRMVDAIRCSMTLIAETGGEGAECHEVLISELEECTKASDEKQREMAEAPSLRREERILQPELFADVLVRTGQASTEEVEWALALQEQGDSRRLGEILVEKGVILTEDVAQALQVQKRLRLQQKRMREDSVRLGTDLLDGLMNLVGDLVLTRNRIMEQVLRQGDTPLRVACQQLHTIATDLQQMFMKTRLQPVARAWNRLPRLVRDLARTCCKEVRLRMEGRETELDRMLIEAIRDPLTHAVRNAIDHGLEAPEERLAQGKSREGTLTVRARHEAGLVHITVTDDGSGIDPDEVAMQALDKGLVTIDDLKGTDERENLQLIFLPGFSTAQDVTTVSGRGVGMDVIKDSIESLGGSIEIHSALGKGTTLTMKIPLTLAILRAFLVTIAGHTFAIPQANVIELVRIRNQDLRYGIERTNRGLAYELRGQLLPLVDLLDVLQLDRTGLAGRKSWSAKECSHVLVLQADGRHFGVVVQQVTDVCEVVVKSLGRSLAGLSSYAGVTLLGEGRPALILNIASLVRESSVVSHLDDLSAFVPWQEEQASEEKTTDLLVFMDPGNGRLAVRASDVIRLEKFATSAIELVNGQEVVRYGQRILPLFCVSELARGRSPGGWRRDEAKDVEVVVCEHAGAPMGLVADPVVDIVSLPLEEVGRSTTAGVDLPVELLQPPATLMEVAAIATLAGIGETAE